MEKMKNLEGKIVTIEYIAENSYARIEEMEYNWDLRAFEPLEGPVIKKSDLKCGDIVTYRNGNKRIFNGEKIVYLSDFDNLSFELSDYDNNLSINSSNDGYDIIKVYRPETEEIFITKNEVKEITIAEIEKELGYKIKIIKEEK